MNKILGYLALAGISWMLYKKITDAKNQSKVKIKK